MKAVILAGGLGSRLKPFTEIIPKPLLPIGESSVLEIIIKNLKKNGFSEIFISTYYMADYVKTFLGDGKKYGVLITYSLDGKPLGTCGPILKLKEYLKEPFLLVNGDILTTFDFRKVYKFAQKTNALLTVVTKEIIAPFEFGNVRVKGDYLTGIVEKPTFKMEILAGIYVLKPQIFPIIPPKTYYGIDSLILDMLKAKKKVARYKMHDYWLDIGRMSDFEAARKAYKDNFKKKKQM